MSIQKVKVRGQMARSQGLKIDDLTRIERFRTVTPVWIHRWLRNDAQRLMGHRRGALYFPRSSVKFQGHTDRIMNDFDSKWAFPECNSSLNSQTNTKLCTKIEGTKRRSPIVFRSHPLNFKVTRAEKSAIWPIWAFRDDNSQLHEPRIFYLSGHRPETVANAHVSAHFR